MLKALAWGVWFNGRHSYLRKCVLAKQLHPLQCHHCATCSTPPHTMEDAHPSFPPSCARCRSGWNQVDVLVVAISLVVLVAEAAGVGRVAWLRALKAMR